MTEPTNEKLTEDIAGIKEALGKKADNSTVEGLLKRSDVRPKALVDGPEDEAPRAGRPDPVRGRHLRAHRTSRISPHNKNSRKQQPPASGPTSSRPN